MASKSTAGVALFFCFNLLFFTLCTASHHYKGCPPPPPPYPTPTPTPVPPTPVTPTPVPPTPTTPEIGKCPRDALKLGVCANVLSGLLNVTLGTPPVKPCCSILHGLIDLEAAVCLCTALKANILGINLNLPISLSLLLNVCSKNVPKGFLCP